jgi:hypothetical protein
MEEYGLSEKQIIEIVNDHNEQYITEVLDVVDIKIRADKIDNVAAYTFTAIKEDYRPKKSVKEKLIEGQDKALKELARIAEEQKKLHEKIERDYFE